MTDWRFFFISLFSFTAKIRPPVVTCPPPGIEGATSVKLLCDHGTTTSMVKQWTRDGQPLVPNDRIEFQENNAVLTIKDVKRTDSGEYHCNVSNFLDHEVAACILMVNCKYSPRIFGFDILLLYRNCIQSLAAVFQTFGFRFF